MRLLHELLISVSLLSGSTLAAAASKVIIDTSGKEVTIPAEPKRIAVAADRSFGELFAATGFAPVALAGTGEYAPYLQEAFANYDDIIKLGDHNQMDIEALAAAQPDLIVMRNIEKYGDPKFYEQAIQIAPVVQLDSTVGLREVIGDFGQIFGQQYSDDLNARVDAAVAKMAAAVDDPSTVQVSHGSLYEPDRVNIFPENTNMASQLIREAGYARPESQQRDTDEIVNNGVDISYEKLSMLDGEVLFLNTSLPYEEAQARLMQPLWQQLDVVKNGKVVLTDWRVWNLQGPLAAERIANDFVAGMQKVGLAKP